MVEVKDDLFLYSFTNKVDAICITTNGNIKKAKKYTAPRAIMGKGIAYQASRIYFRYCDIDLGYKIRSNGNIVQTFAYYTVPHQNIDTAIVAFPTKHNWWQYSDLELIKTSIVQLIDLTNKRNWRKVTLTRPGCGNGGLKWEDVKPLLVDKLDDRFIVVNDGM